MSKVKEDRGPRKLSSWSSDSILSNIKEDLVQRKFSFVRLSFRRLSSGRSIECVTDLDLRSKIIIFRSILTTFESGSIFGGSWGSIANWFEPKTKPPSENLACPNQ